MKSRKIIGSLRRGGMQIIVVLLLLSACAPVVRPTPKIIAPQVTAIVADEENVFGDLVSVFTSDLDGLGIGVTSFEAFDYQGSDKNVFFKATNEFYQNNPGYCPLKHAFFAAENGLVFMTLASDGHSNIRGFLYDQSQRPSLKYAYFKGISTDRLPAINCQTVEDNG